METILYYINLLVALCGFDGSDGNATFGWIVISLASIIVVYAFYEGITKALWPGELDASHIKYRILDDDAESPHAH